MELGSMTESLRSLASSGQTGEILSLMIKLGDVAVTPDRLRSTGLNILLNELRKHANPEIAGGAKQLVIKYKAAIGAANPQNEKRKAEEESREDIAKVRRTSEAVNGIDKSQEHIVHNKIEDKVAEGPSLQATPLKEMLASNGSDNPSTPPISQELPNNKSYELGKTGDSDRDKSQSLIFTALASHGECALSLRTELAVKIEASLFQKLGSGEGKVGAKSAEYRGQLKSLIMNLRDASNPDLNRRILSGEVAPEDTSSMTEYDMASDALKSQRNKLERESIDARRSDWEREKGTGGTDMFKCGKCKKRRCTYYQKQTRSSDEPMTTFITCLECGHRWREY